jgi:ParB-like chromosome segregation protein Spo0J
LIVRQSDRMVCGGHTRLKAMKLLGRETTPVTWIECDDRTFRRLALALNKLGELADWRRADLK